MFAFLLADLARTIRCEKFVLKYFWKARLFSLIWESTIFHLASVVWAVYDRGRIQLLVSGHPLHV